MEVMENKILRIKQYSLNMILKEVTFDKKLIT